MKNILTEAKERIYLSLPGTELGQVEQELKEAVQKGLKVVIITTPGSIIDGAQAYYNEKQPGQIRIIADTSHVLTGDTASGSNSAALYSRNRNLIDLIKDSLTNEIRLIQLRDEVKPI
jgi:sugar-specific transcriptional regulator TrmB